MMENLENLMKTRNIHIQEAQWTPSTRNMKKTTPRLVIAQTSDKSLKNCKGEKKVVRGTSIQKTWDLLLIRMQVRRQWNNVFEI